MQDPFPEGACIRRVAFGAQAGASLLSYLGVGLKGRCESLIQQVSCNSVGCLPFTPVGDRWNSCATGGNSWSLSCCCAATGLMELFGTANDCVFGIAVGYKLVQLARHVKAESVSWRHDFIGGKRACC